MAERGICVVGAGRWGRNHIRTLREMGRLGGVVDSDELVLDAVRETAPDAQVFQRLEDALEAGFAGYVVATPARTHAELARFLIERGCPVLVEKPMALDAASARSLSDFARARGVPLMVGHLLLFHPAIREMKALIDAGKLGRLQYIYSNRLNLGTVRTEENILWSFAPHDISIFQALIGARPTEVLSRGGDFVQPRIHDSTMTLLRYPGDVVAHIFVSWLHPFKEHRLVVIGSEGMLSYEDSGDRELRFYEKGIDFIQGKPVKRDGPTELIPYAPQMPLRCELEYFCARVDDGGPIEIASGRSGVEVLEILEAASQSLLGGEATVAAEAPVSPDYFAHESAYVDEGAGIGPGTKIWHFSHVQGGAQIGAECVLGQNVNVGPGVRIGSRCKIQNNVSVYEGVELEDDVFCGPSMVFTNVRDPRSAFPRKAVGESFDRTRVGRGVTLGANCTVVCGNDVGAHAFVAAGAVVTHDVPKHALVAGVPAKQIGWVCACGQTLPAAVGDMLSCPRCDRSYTACPSGAGLIESDAA